MNYLTRYGATGMACALVWTPEIDAALTVQRDVRFLCPLCWANTGWNNRGSTGGHCGRCMQRFYGPAVPDRAWVGYVEPLP